MTEPRISNLLSVSEAYHTEVNIIADFDDSYKIEGYIPNEASRQALKEIIPGLMPTSTKRVHPLTGTYGTGKSHFGLILASLLRKRSEAASILNKIGEKDRDLAGNIRRYLQASKKYLVIMPEIHLYRIGFNRALLIALDTALEREKIVFRPKSHYSAAVNVIEHWQMEGAKNPEDNPYKKLENALRSHRTTPEVLKDNLKKYSENDYDIFEKVHPQVAYGATFQPSANADPRELYAQTIQFLRSSGDWEGICLICDEFGRYLTDLAKDPSSWGGQSIQDFAEYCRRSDENQCHFVVITHQTLASYAAYSRNKEEWKKISGRFIPEHSLENVSSRHESIEMIDTILMRQVDPEREVIWQRIVNHPDVEMLIDALRNANLYAGQGTNWLRNTLTIGCFPLHPFASFCLPWLAQRVGQRERTLFTFFNDMGQGGLRDYVEKQPIVDESGRLNLYTLDRLIAYFGPAAASTEGDPRYRQIIRTREDAIASVGQNALSQRIINALAVFEIVGADNIEPTEANLIVALHLSSSEADEAKQLLIVLSESVIRRRRDNDFLELRHRKGDFDLQEAIQQEKETLLSTFTSIDALQQLDALQEKLSPIQANSYEKQHFVKRTAVRDLVVPASLSNPKEFMDRIKSWYEPSRKKYEGDALILYMLAEDTAEIKQAEKYLAIDDCQHPQLIVAVPKKPVQVTENLLQIAAAERAKVKVYDSAQYDEADIEDLERVIEVNKNLVNEAIDDFIHANNLIWYCDGNSTSNMEKGGEEEYISNLLKRRFSKTPAVRDDAIANIPTGRDTTKKYRQQVVTKLLEHKGYITIKKTGGGADERIFRSCLRDTEVLEQKEDKGAYADYEVREKLPKDAVLREIWQVIYDDLIQLQERVDLDKIVCKLLEPPYGLSHQLIEILLAAFFRNRQDEFVVWGNLQKAKKSRNAKFLSPIKNLDADTITSIVANPSDYVLGYFEVRPTEKEYVNRIIERVALDEDKSSEMGIWERGRDALLGWFTDLPPISVSAQSYDNSHTNNLVDLLKDETKTEDAKDLFRLHLPDVFELSLSSPPTSSETEDLFEKFEKCYLELTNYTEAQALFLVRELAKNFGVEGSTRNDLAKAINDWYNALTEAQQLYRFEGDADYLKRAIVSDETIDQRMLVDLPKSMGLGAYENWTNVSTPQLFLTRVELAKQKIETWQPASTPSGGSSGTGGSQSDPVELAKIRVKAVLASFGLPDDLQKRVLEELLEEI